MPKVDKTEQQESGAEMFLSKNPEAIDGYKTVSIGARLVRPREMPIGSAIEGRLLDVVGNITDDPELDDNGLLHISVVVRGAERKILFPITGTIAHDGLRIKGGIPALVGKNIALRREDDGASARYGGNQMFMIRLLVPDTVETTPVPTLSNGLLTMSPQGDIEIVKNKSLTAGS